MALSIERYLERGPATSKEIQAETGLSQAGVSRQIGLLGDRIIKMRVGRSYRYALTCNAFGGDDRLPVCMVDAHGNTVAAAILRPLAHGGFFVEPLIGAPEVLLGEGGIGLYDDLPYFLSDLRPQGFLGRQIAEELSASTEFPADPRNWTSSHVGRYLVSNGEDLPGNLKFGQQALSRVRRKPEVTTVQDYPVLADGVMSGIIPDSSAGGEQPKFTAYCGERLAHVIVKFSPKADNEVTRRWRDILITEYHAIEAIQSEGFPAADTRIFEADGRIFLESERFDRRGEYGRMPMISLQAVDAEFTGLGSDWQKVIVALYHKNLVSWQHVFDAVSLWYFGRLINNTDMHLGNLSLGIEGKVFRLLPVYDMCSMGFVPKSGDVPQFDFVNSESLLEDAIFTPSVFIEDGAKGTILRMARKFWNDVASDQRISEEFSEFLSNSDLLS